MRKQSMSFAAGLLVGAALFGCGTAYAAGVLAQRSTSPVYVDGKLVQLEAYNINGNNYVKLRDIGQALDFNVYWDGSVQVDSNAAYTGVLYWRYPKAKCHTKSKRHAPNHRDTDPRANYHPAGLEP